MHLNLQASANPLCFVCEKTVYIAERVDIKVGRAPRVYHKHCLRCEKCKTILTYIHFLNSKDKIQYEFLNIAPWMSSMLKSDTLKAYFKYIFFNEDFQ